MSFTDVLFTEISGKSGNVGVITLNRPKVLNSLNHAMVKAMLMQLNLWANAAEIKAVVINAAEGRAFCAGGDLRSLWDRHHARDEHPVNFFRDEYQLNRCIFHFPKPYIALLDGITMGGGVGISIHGSHRIASDKLLFAMPETGIGFFPDVGGTYFLPRLKGHMGYYLALSGSKITSDECLALGLVQYKMSSEQMPLFLEALANEPLAKDPKQAVTRLIQEFLVGQEIPRCARDDKIVAGDDKSITRDDKNLVGDGKGIERQAIINESFKFETMEEIIESLQQSPSTIAKDIRVDLSKKSPTSLKVTLKALQNGQKSDFDSCMQQEFRLVNHFLQHHDFIEGIRSVIIDKDQQPKWRPNSLKDVTKEMVDKYFQPLSIELISDRLY